MPLSTLAAACSNTLDIKKSRFVATAFQAVSPAEAMEHIARSARTPASHHAWAYRIGDQFRFHDAGEPSGTAGKPILQAIDGQQFDRVVVIVSRWFGGIELGTGGLARAYGGVAAACLREGVRVPIVVRMTVCCVCPFGDLERVKNRLSHYQAEIANESFGESGATLTLHVPQAVLATLQAAVADLTRGRADWHHAAHR